MVIRSSSRDWGKEDQLIPFLKLGFGHCSPGQPLPIQDKHQVSLKLPLLLEEGIPFCSGAGKRSQGIHHPGMLREIQRLLFTKNLNLSYWRVLDSDAPILYRDFILRGYNR